MTRLLRYFPPAGLSLLVLAAPAFAVQPRSPGGGGPGGWPPPEALVSHPRELSVPTDPAVQAGLRAGHAGIRAFLRARRSWRATVDPHAGGVDRAFGRGLELDGPAGEQSGRDWIVRHRELFAAGLDMGPASLVYNPEGSRPLAGGPARVLQFDLHQRGLPVLGAGLSLGLHGDDVVLVASRALGPVAAPSRPGIDIGSAIQAVEDHVGRGGSPPDLTTRREPSLAFYPLLEPAGASGALRHRLVWILEVKPADAPEWDWYVAYVDARTAEVLALFPDTRNLGSCQADPAQAHATGLGGVRLNRADDTEVIRHLPFLIVDIDGTLVTSDLNGRFPYSGGLASSVLEGRDIRVHCDSCTQPTEPSASMNSSGDISFGTGGGSTFVPIIGNGTSTPADRTTYFHAHHMRRLLEKWDHAFFDEIDAYVNIEDFCNARSGSYFVLFDIAGGGCRNTGEIRDVIVHELGHSWDRFDGNGITSGALSEWKGDLLAMAFGGDGCVAESFYISGGPSAGCSGVRDLDEKASGRADHPLTPAECPTCATLTLSSNDCGFESHCVGEIIGQASWHLLNNLSTGVDYVTGASLGAGNPALSAEQARWIFERLLLAGGAPMQTYSPSGTGLSAYDAMTLIDDDDADLSNGTPHAAYFNAAFAHHELAESPAVADSAGCAEPADPIVTATADIEPGTGLPFVQIDWTPVGGATEFDVYRNQRDGDAFLPIALGVGGGPIIDRGVQEGIAYRYFVAAVQTTGCAMISPGANIETIVPTVPRVRVNTFTVSEVAAGSDSDGRLEPGERLAVRLTLRESTGTVDATGVTATLSPSAASSPVTGPGPVTYGTVPAGVGAIGSGPFQVFIGPTVPCGSKVPFVVSATGNEGCWVDRFEIALDSSGLCATTPSGFVEVVPGSLQVSAASGDGDGIADNCETSLLSYQVRNNGSLASGPVTAMVSSAHPGVTFVPDAPCTFADLSAGATGDCQVSFSLGAASPAGIPFTVLADSAANPAPSVLQTGVTAESDPPVFTTRVFGFDGDLEGWTGQTFAASDARFSAGTHSAHSGSTSVSNLCGKLTSPIFLLDPAGTSTLGFDLYADIEPLTDRWYDRANVHVVDVATGYHTVIAPASGPAYNAGGNTMGGLCHVTQENGWASLLGGFNRVSFDLSAFAGRRVRIEINYDTDEGDNREGIYIDDLVLTAAADAAAPADPQSDSCFLPEVSAPGAPVALEVGSPATDVFRFTWEDVGPGFQYNLYGGTLGSFYDHGAGAVSCSGVGSGIACDGTACAVDAPGAALPAGDLYFVVTGTAYGMEGTSGAGTAGPRDPAQSTCAP